MIFITGGTGMLGSYLLLELLKTNDAIKASKRKGSSLKITENIFHSFSNNANELLAKIKWVEVDLFDQNNIEEQLTDISEIYHCAAIISASPRNKSQLIDNNQIITQNIVNAALSKDISKFCHVSSIAALGNTLGTDLIKETTLWKEQKDNSTYSISKYKSEMEVWRGIAEGLNAVIVNPSVILGMGDWQKGSANLFKKVDNGLKYYALGSSGFVNASDVVRIMINLMQRKETFGQNYIISAINSNYKNIFSTIAEALKVKAPHIYASPFLTQVVWRAEWIKSKVLGFDPLITKESARTAHKVLQYDNSKLLKAIPFQYQSIEETIQEIANIYSDTEY